MEELYIPDENKINSISGKTTKKSLPYADKLVKESFRLTGNEYATSSTARESWRPAGTIKVWDDVIGSTTTSEYVIGGREQYPCEEEEEDGPEPMRGDSSGTCSTPIYEEVTSTVSGSFIGLNGVKVKARRWFTTHTDITDENGDYECDGTFENDANYSIDWEKYQFSIQDSWMDGARYNGPKITGDWNLNLKDDDNCALSVRVKEIIYNRSNHDIAVTSWFNGDIKDIYSLAVDESITKFGELSDSSLFFTFLDSINILFDNNKKLFLKRIDYDNESALEGGNKCDRLYEFSFTEEHYDKAEPCNGNCE